jgi:glycerol dehydrogenase
VHNGLAACGCTHGYMHGEKVAFGLVTQLVLEGRPHDELKTVLTYCDAVGLPTTLRQVGMDAGDAEAIAAVAARTTVPGETVHNEPFPVTAAMVADAIAAADLAGHRHKDRATPA